MRTREKARAWLTGRRAPASLLRVRVRVSQESVATPMELEHSSGSKALDAAALETVKSWRFSPARRAGDPVAAWAIVPAVFRLTCGS